ncbi:ABC transporter ATP-binding protein [Agrobacterium larrymoorei]|uniref:Capsular polysaccharide transport system ATP-binding protein n=1 Tax=Agrobacterium larrymoorei TaxID=160699 RepID=A0ABU0UI77_9HYPH|nr:ABC transporter ATP-binding protein [Agrobacterium larrymoorei]MDQ1184626.1 capsular polysaccharide transport system ATP-binding protein [Agrobacterium larrymoorei]
MILFENVSKSYRTSNSAKVVLDKATFSIPSGYNLGILGGNGAGKSTLLRLISGAEQPDRGRVARRARVSFPIGFGGTFHGHLTGKQNVLFVARVYGADASKVVEFVRDFSELGDYLNMPVNTYSSGMAAKLAFGMSLAIDFDIYLVDEVTEVGDARFRKKCADAFVERMKRSDIIMVSHNSQTIKAYCDRAAILSNGQLEFFESVDEAMAAHRRMMGASNA